MRTLGIINDPIFQPKEHSFLNRFFLKLIEDERDLPFVHLCLLLTFTLVPSGFILYFNILTGWMWWLHASLHLAWFVYLLGAFTLMLHNTSHRPFFKASYGILNHYIPWFLGCFMGQSPELYYSHHIGMHHSEGNMPEDRSSTMPYQRDSFMDFCHYFFRFLFIGIFDVIAYFSTQNPTKRRRFTFMTVGEFLYWAFCIGLCFVNGMATLFVFILPVIIVRGGMMSGNWSQHAFIDPNDPENSYKNSITCINTPYNKMCFNDGYHIGHHLVPNMHWTDMPTDFIKNKALYAENKAVVFEGLDYHQIWFYLMTKRYDKLAAHFVNLGNQFQSDDEIIAFLKERTRKFPTEKLATA